VLKIQDPDIAGPHNDRLEVQLQMTAFEDCDVSSKLSSKDAQQQLMKLAGCVKKQA